MIRMGGGPGGSSDPEEERKAANAAVLKNTMIFGFLVASINAAPYILAQMGVEVSL